MSSTLPKKVTNIVWGDFNGRCAMCSLVLSRTFDKGNSATIAKIAHIVGEKEGSARFSNSLTLEQRNSPPNLMLLCGTHHDMVDHYDSEYSVEDLHTIKNDFMAKIQTVFQENLLGVGFAELEVAIKYLVDGNQASYEGSLEIITPSEKIKKNELGANIEGLLRMGLVQENQLEDFLNRNPDTSFASRLRNIVVTEYKRLKQEGLSANEIFYKIMEFASSNSSDFKKQAAGLTVISYYFNVCDIFEK